jgi:hypothetical protein
MIIVIVVGFITGLVLLKNALNKSCSYGEVYDNKLGCIKDCSPGRQPKIVNGYTYCVSNIIQAFNFSYGLGWAVLTSDFNNTYIYGGLDSINTVFNFSNKLVTDNIKTIFFEPTGDITYLKELKIRQFPGDAVVYSFNSIFSINQKEYLQLMSSGYNYYLEPNLSKGSIRINVYFS